MLNKKTPHPLRVILMGTGPFAVPTFAAILAAGYDATLVVTRPQPAVKSRGSVPPGPVRQWAEDNGLPIFDPPSINDPQAIERLVAEKAMLLVVCDYGQILKPEALRSTTLGGINLHGSLLPEYRGAAPVQWSVLSGDTATGVTVIHMTPRLDGGPILATSETPIGVQETAGELESRLSQLGISATLSAIETLSDWDGVSPIGRPQDPTRVSKAPRLQKTDGEIDFTKSSRHIDCQVRALQPWPIAYTHLVVSEGKPPLRIAIKQVTILDNDVPRSDNVGEILPGSELDVVTSSGAVRIERLQPAGKREMTGREFRCGYQSIVGPMQRLST